MPQKKRHILIPNDALEKEIDSIIAKLNPSRTTRQIQNWLENFEADEVPYVLNFLLFFDYITFEDLQSRLDPLINEGERVKFLNEN